MGKTIVIPQKGGLIDEVLGLLLCDRDGGLVDYSSNLVVFPNKRPAHFIRSGLSRSIKTAFIPPTVISIEEFIDNLYEIKRPEDRKISALDAVAILFDLHLNSKSRIGRDSFIEIDTFLPIGMILFRDLEALKIDCLSSHRLNEIPLDNLPRSMESLQNVGYFYSGFYKRLDEAGYSTRSSRFQYVSEAFEANDLKAYSRIIFAGFYALTRSETGLFSKLLTMDNSYILFQDGQGLKDRLSALGIDVGLEGSRSGAVPKLHLYRCPDLHLQTLTIGRLLQSTPKSKNEETLVLLPNSEALFPLIRNSLSVLPEDGYNISIGYPLHRTPLYEFFNGLMELCANMQEDKVYLTDYTALTLHPYIKNLFFSNGNSEPTRIIFHYLEEELSSSSRSFMTLQEIESVLDKALSKVDIKGLEGISQDDIVNHIRHIHRETIEPFSRFDNLSHFATVCRNLIHFIYENSTAPRHPFFFPFCESFLGVFREIEMSIASSLVFRDLKSYFNFFRTYIKGCRMPFEGAPIRGLQVLGPLETRGLRFKRVLIVEANDDLLPGSPSVDSLIPENAKNVLAIPTFRDRDRIASYYFETLISNAEEVHIFYTDNSKRELSRFVEHLIWQRQKAAIEMPKIEALQYRIRLDTQRPEAIAKDSQTIDVLKGLAFSPSAIDAYLRCQISFYYRYVLGLSEKRSLSGDIDSSVIGKFVHEVLSEYFRPIHERFLNRDLLKEDTMTSLCQDLFNRHFGGKPRGEMFLVYRQISKRLRELFQRYFIPLSETSKLKVLSTEQTFDTQYHGFRISGKIDTVWLRDGQTWIVDYKTSTNNNRYKIAFEKLDIDRRDTWTKAIGSIQLPLYLVLYSSARHVPLDGLTGMLLFIGRSRLEAEKIAYTIKGSELLDRRLDVLIEMILSEIVDANQPFIPPADFREACKYCPFTGLCGTQWAL